MAQTDRTYRKKVKKMIYHEDVLDQPLHPEEDRTEEKADAKVNAFI